MINSLLILALGSILMIAAFGARALNRLHRQCHFLEHGKKIDYGLLRWYAQGFEYPLRITRWLVRISLMITLAALLAKAHPLLIAASLLVLSLSYMELRFGGRRKREHQRVVATLSSLHPP